PAGAGDVEGRLHHGAPAGAVGVALLERRGVEGDRDAARAVDAQHGRVGDGAPGGAGPDELVVLLGHTGLGVVGYRVDGNRAYRMGGLVDLVARRLVGEQPGGDRADELVAGVAAELAVVGHLADHGAGKLPAGADGAHLVEALGLDDRDHPLLRLGDHDLPRL